MVLNIANYCYSGTKESFILFNDTKHTKRLLLPILATLILLSNLSAENHSIFDVKIGMSISQINDLNICKRIRQGKVVKQVTSTGLRQVPTGARSIAVKFKSTYFQYGKVDFKNDKMSGLSILMKKNAQHRSHKIFSKMLRQFGTSYSAHPFKSFRDEGVSFVWQAEESLYGINVIVKNMKVYNCQVFIKDINENDLDLKFLELHSPRVKSILSILGVHDRANMLSAN